jgi:phosphoribosylanthranilate isomerase
VLVTHLIKGEAIADLVRFTGCQAVQLHDDIGADEISILRKLIPLSTLLKTLHVDSQAGKQNIQDIEEQTDQFIPFVDGFVIDTINPAEDRIGGTGLTHDWELSRKIVADLSMPAILAGGLNPENVKEAIRIVRPYGVDINSGVERSSHRNNRRKDTKLVQEFIQNALDAFAKYSPLDPDTD